MYKLFLSIRYSVDDVFKWVVRYIIPVTCAFVDLYKTYGPTLNLVAEPCFEFKYDNNESDDGMSY